MIKCPNCQQDNQIGAIFCRTCGDKINIDDIQPEQLIQKKSTFSMKNIGSMVRTLVGLGILACLGFGFWSLFRKPVFSEPGVLDSNQRSACFKKVKGFTAANKPKQATFNQDEITYLATDMLGLTPEQKTKDEEARVEAGEEMMLVPEDIWVIVRSDNTVKAILRSRLRGKWDVYSVVIGHPTATQTGGMGFEITEVAMGRVPIPIPAFQERVTERFTALLDLNEHFQSFSAKVKAIEVSGSTVTISP